MKAPVWKNNVCVITGASSGIGRALALLLAQQGAWLGLAARDEQQLEIVAEACRQYGARALVVPTDVGDEAQCRRLVARVVEEYGHLDTLINNAGISMTAQFEEISDLSILETIMRVNLHGSVYCTYHALPHLRQSQGRLVGIASLTGKTGVPTRSFYAASKHAMAGFFDSLRIELMGSGVSVTMIYPGFVATEVRQRALGPDGRPRQVSHIDEKKAMSAEVCARLILPAMEKRRRELVMTFKGKIGQWIKLIAPALVDRIARQTMMKGK
jgi:short-subunit dehydrogenase